jgi:hypothetical protein
LDDIDVDKSDGLKVTDVGIETVVRGGHAVRLTFSVPGAVAHNYNVHDYGLNRELVGCDPVQVLRGLLVLLEEDRARSIKLGRKSLPRLAKRTDRIWDHVQKPKPGRGAKLVL